MPSDPCASWRNPRVLLTLTLVFLCGLLAGGVSIRYGIHQWTQKKGTPLPGNDKEISLQRLTRELDLTAEQSKRLEVVLDDFVKYVQTLQAQMDDVRATGKERIMRILDDEQKKKFEAMLDGLQARNRGGEP